MFYASPSRAIVGVVIAQTLFPTTGAQDVDTAREYWG